MGPNNRSEQRCGLYPRNGVQLTAKNAKNTEGEELGWVTANPRVAGDGVCPQGKLW